jgi:hypothetical protein
MVGAHIDDFMIGGTTQNVIDTFRERLLTRFAGTREGTLHHYLGFRITCDLEQGVTTLDQAHYTKRVLKMFDAWNIAPKKMPMLPDTRLSIDDCNHGYVEPSFHKKYRWLVEQHDAPRFEFCFLLPFPLCAIPRTGSHGRHPACPRLSPWLNRPRPRITPPLLTPLMGACGGGWMRIMLVARILAKVIQATYSC